MPTMFEVLDHFGIVVAAVAGALMAGRKHLDLMGVLIVAVLASVGGGTLRDVLLDRRVFWLEAPRYILVAGVTACGVFAWTRLRDPAGGRLGPIKTPEKLGQVLLLADALALAVFNVIGLLAAEPEGVSAVAVILMGGLTGVAGGLLRDVVCNEMPVVFRGTLYLTCALAGGVLFVCLRGLGVEMGVCAWAGFALTAALRIGAITRQWHLPTFALGE